jgi:hypothetical protein
MRYAILCLLVFVGVAPAHNFGGVVVGHSAFVAPYVAPAVVVQKVEIPTCQVAPVAAVSGYAFGHVSAISAVRVVRQRAVIVAPVVRRRAVFRHR